MKKIILTIIVLGLFITSLCIAGGKGVSGKGMSGGATAAGVTWDHEVKCEDNAASTVVVNDSDTGKANWVAGANTDTYSTATHKEGDKAFNLDGSGDRIYSGENWTSEEYTAYFWWYPANATAADIEYIFGIHDAVVEFTSLSANEFILGRKSGSDEITVRCDGDSTEGEKTTTDFAPSATTWYDIKVVVDATSSPWSVDVYYSTDGVEYTQLTFGAWDVNPGIATVNDPIYVGTNSTKEPDAIIDHVRIKDDS